MQIESVSATFGQKFNLGNYEAVEISIFFHAKLEEGEDPQAGAELLTEMAKETVYRAAEEVLEAAGRKPAIKRFFMGKEVTDETPF